jgi:predicted enzyme related to lactoylglutathione lyase
MIRKMSHSTVYVKNHDEALAFYTGKLGFEVREDAKMPGFRWVTVGPKGQPDLEIILMETKVGGMFDQETVNGITALLERGKLGAGVFATDDCQKTYEELKSRGVEFFSPPQKRPYGTEALFKDNSGNWFSLTERT